MALLLNDIDILLILVFMESRWNKYWVLKKIMAYIILKVTMPSAICIRELLKILSFCNMSQGLMFLIRWQMNCGIEFWIYFISFIPYIVYNKYSYFFMSTIKRMYCINIWNSHSIINLHRFFQVAQSEPLSFRQAQEFAWSDLPLEMELSEIHFASGKLLLQCVAEVAGIYREEATLKLDSARDPVPERGR